MEIKNYFQISNDEVLGYLFFKILEIDTWYHLGKMGSEYTP